MKKVAIEIFVLSKKHFVCIQVHVETKVNIFKWFTVQLLPVGQILVTCFVKIDDQVPISLERSDNRRAQKRFFFGKKAQTQKREYLQPICSVYFFILIACFYSYASFIILLPYVLFVKL